MRQGIPIFAKLLLVVLVAGIVFVLLSAWKEMDRSKRIEGEVEKLRMEADRIRNENRTISEKIAYFSTPEFEEREAKEKLGMKRKDEEMVSVELKGLTSSDSGSDLPEVTVSRENMPNYLKWWAFFFRKE